MVLVDCLEQLRNHFGYRLVVCHVNYGLERHADQAETSVREWCEQHSIGFVGISSLYSPGESTQRKGQEGFLRSQRYRFFESCGESLGIDGVFLAHHADDQSETLIQRMGRGTGPYGLAGMRPVSNQRSISLYRPFLSLRKRKLKEYAREKNLDYVQDPSNQTPSFLRNRIRNELLARWEELQPQVHSSLNRLSTMARQENEFWENYLEEQFVSVSWPLEIHVDRETFSGEPRAARARYLQRIPRQLGGDHPPWSYQHIEELLKFFKEESGKFKHLPGSIRAVVEYERVAFYPESSLPDPPNITDPHWDSGEIKLSGIGRIKLRPPGTPPSEKGMDIPSCLLQDCSVRAWQTSDTIRLGEEQVALTEIFQEERIPLRARQLWPVLVKQHKILCLPGLAVSSHISKTDDELLEITFSPDHPSFRDPNFFD